MSLARHYSLKEIQNILVDYDRNKINETNTYKNLPNFDVLPITIKTELFTTNINCVSEYGEKLSLIIKHNGFPFAILINTLDKTNIDIVKNTLQSILKKLESPTELNMEFNTTNLIGRKYRFDYEKGKRPRGYTNELYTYMIITPSTIALRNLLITKIKNDEKYPIYCVMCNDDTVYHRILGRELGISFTDWIHINKYTLAKDPTTQKLQAEPINKGYRWLQVNTSDITKSSKIHKSEPSIIMGWDIETTMLDNTNCVPFGDDPNSRVYMISMVFCDYDNPVPFLRLCLIDTPCYDASLDDYYHTFVCNNELELIMTFADIINIIKPDYITGFNDGEYDWPFLLAKLKKYNSINDFIVRINQTRKPMTEAKFKFCKDIKLVKGNLSKIITLQDPGFITLDTRLVLRKWHHQEKTSLNAYLTANNLDLKDDMPIPLTFKYYRERDPVGLQKVAHYCVIDATRCYELLFKLKMISCIRDECSLAFVSFVDGIYYANAMKVKNLIAHYAYHHNPRIYFPMGNTGIKVVAGKYQGAVVFPPDKGVEKSWPTIAFDFASLYPSLIQTYNLSPDTWVPAIDLVDEESGIVKSGSYVIPLANLQSNNGVLMLDTLNTGEENCNFIRHNNNLDNFGIYPKIMYELMKERSRLKKIMFDYQLQLEAAVSSGASESVISDLAYFHADANSKQNAVKVFMNSFYGEAGNAQSPLYLRQLAASITYLGRRNITFVVDFITKDMGCKMKYGDTDSMYIQLPVTEYSDIIESKYSNRQDYAVALINRMFERTQKYQQAVNNLLIKDNGTPYLKMAYEEVLFPSIFLGKKKYLGIKHIGIAGFNNDDKSIFKRGMDFLKEGNCNFVKTIGMEIVRRLLDISDTNTDVLQIVLQTINDIKTQTINSIDRQSFVNKFIQTGKYNSNKANIQMKTFVNFVTDRYNKMLTEIPIKSNIAIYSPPEPGSRFDYVVIKKNTGFDVRGHKITYKTGEIMELADIVKLDPYIDIDIDYYLEHYVTGNSARFINFLDQFNDSSVDLTTLNNETYQKMDKDAITKAKNYLSNKLIVKTYDKDAAKEQRKMFNSTKKIIETNIITFVNVDSARIKYNTKKVYKYMTRKLITTTTKPIEVAIRFKSYIDNYVINKVVSNIKNELELKMEEFEYLRDKFNVNKMVEDTIADDVQSIDSETIQMLKNKSNEIKKLLIFVKSHEMLKEYNESIMKID